MSEEYLLTPRRRFRKIFRGKKLWVAILLVPRNILLLGLSIEHDYSHPLWPHTYITLGLIWPVLTISIHHKWARKK